jgi:signal transduction histidine kinase
MKDKEATMSDLVLRTQPISSQATRSPTIHAQTERELYLEYERDRRRRLTSIIAPLIGVLAGICTILFGTVLVLAAVVKIPVPIAGYILECAVLALSVLLIYSTHAVRQGKVNVAAGLTVSGISLTILLFQSLWVLSQGIDPYGLILFTALDFVIVLVGVLGDMRTILGLTAVVSLEASALWMYAPRNPALSAIIQRELLIIGPASVLVLWGLAILQIAVQRTTRSTLAELGAVQVAYARAQKLDELKDQFISSVNHELRTPLSAMLGFLEILDLSVERATPQQLHAIIQDANEAGEDLNLLVNSILETRRLDQSAANFTPECVPLYDVLERAIRLIDPRESKVVERNLHLHIPPDFVIWGERIRLQQILINLLSNAIKYSEPGTPVEIWASKVIMHVVVSNRRRRKITEERVMGEIVVRDHGLGVPAEDIPLLFQRFVRLPRDLASPVNGNGLGLYLCRVFAEAMGGSIWVESSGIPGEGSEFHLQLPLPPTPLG